LELLNIEEGIVTIDAMGTQKSMAAQIIDQQGGNFYLGKSVKSAGRR